MTNKTLEVAETIREQIGHQAFVMMGTKRFMGDEKSLSFKIQGCRKINHIKIELAFDDTYTMTFIKLKKFDFVEVAKFEGVYCDMLNSIIEKETGLYLSL